MPATSDRRIARTQQSLHKAHLSLILEKGYEATTVGHIISRANVGRSTLYAHYGNKEGLLLSGLEHLRTLLLKQQAAAFAAASPEQRQPLSFSGTFFQHLHEHRPIVRALAGNRGGEVITTGLRRLLVDLVRNEVSHAKGSRAAIIPRDAVIAFTAETFLTLLRWWFESSPKLSPAEIDQVFRQLTLPGFESALSSAQ